MLKVDMLKISKRDVEDYLKIKNKSLHSLQNDSLRKVLKRIKKMYCELDFIERFDEIIQEVKEIKELKGVEEAYKMIKEFIEKGEDKKAVIYLKQISQDGYAPAQNDLGYIFDLEDEYEKAVKWYKKSAEQNYPPAQNNLGYMYTKGLGVRKDYLEAEKWYKRAASQGDDIAEENLKILGKLKKA